MKPKTLILRTAGTNCDQETAYAFELAGADTEAIHLNRLLENPKLMGEFQLLAVPGGFSYGDDIAAGKIFANQIIHHLRDAFSEFVAAGKPIIGICNGFQVLVKTDLLPGTLAGKKGQTATLAHNDCGRFIDRWVTLEARESKCIWTQNLSKLDLPIAHGEGKFVVAEESIRKALWDGDQVALVYSGENPNGSTDAIAGVCDDTGLIFGLMPHPERHVSPLQHPAWTSRGSHSGEGAGLEVFRNAVRHVQESLGARV
jgi:phosphoribosylformylglycinamidine synthase